MRLVTNTRENIPDKNSSETNNCMVGRPILSFGLIFCDFYLLAHLHIVEDEVITPMYQWILMRLRIALVLMRLRITVYLMRGREADAWRLVRIARQTQERYQKTLVKGHRKSRVFDDFFWV